MESDAETQGLEASGAQNELGEVQTCDCGGVNLVMGPMTLHFAPEEVPDLFDLVTVAMELVHKHDTEGESGNLSGRRSKAVGIVH